MRTEDCERIEPSVLICQGSQLVVDRQLLLVLDPQQFSPGSAELVLLCLV